MPAEEARGRDTFLASRFPTWQPPLRPVKEAILRNIPFSQTVSHSLFTRAFSLLIFGFISLGFISACGGSNSEESTISIQLDWTPNTNHVGIYIALANGWYEEEGINVEIVPYSDANPDVVVANGLADIGISFPPNLIFSRAAGLDLISIAAVLQSNPTELAVLESSDILRPRDFDGRIYAGFGLPFEESRIKAVIRADGGQGEFTVVTLSTFAYEALYNERADFTEIFTTWEGIEAELRGVKLRTFRFNDFGVPDFPGVILIAQQSTVSERSDVLRRFLEVTRRGYEFAANQPEEATRIFIAYVGEDVFPEAELVRLSNIMLADVFVDTNGSWGLQDAKVWDAYATWMVAQGILVGVDNEVISGEVPGGPLFTNLLDSPE